MVIKMKKKTKKQKIDPVILVIIIVVAVTFIAVIARYFTNSQLWLECEKDITEEYNEVIKDLVIAADSFVIDRPIFGLHSCLAGYPWFLD